MSLGFWFFDRDHPAMASRSGGPGPSELSAQHGEDSYALESDSGDSGYRRDRRVAIASEGSSALPNEHLSPAGLTSDTTGFWYAFRQTTLLYTDGQRSMGPPEPTLD